MTSYRLMIPSWHDINDNVIVVYDVEAMLALRHSDKDLTGHPSKDLPPETWGTIPFPARKAARWAAKNRLLKVRRSATFTNSR